MALVEIVVKPLSSRGDVELARHLESALPHYDAVFLPLPRSMTWVFKIPTGPQERGPDVEEVLNEVIAGYGAHALLGIKESIKTILREPSERLVVCYVSDETIGEQIDFGSEVARLVLRASLTGRINVQEWRELLNRGSSNSLVEDAYQSLLEYSPLFERAILVAGYEARKIKELLKGAFEVTTRYVGQPHAMSPLETLIRLMALREVSDEELRRYVRMHVEYIKNYVVPLGVERGNDEWNRRSLWWLRSRERENASDNTA